MKSGKGEQTSSFPLAIFVFGFFKRKIPDERIITEAHSTGGGERERERERTVRQPAAGSVCAVRYDVQAATCRKRTFYLPVLSPGMLKIIKIRLWSNLIDIDGTTNVTHKASYSKHELVCVCVCAVSYTHLTLPTTPYV